MDVDQEKEKEEEAVCPQCLKVEANPHS